MQLGGPLSLQWGLYILIVQVQSTSLLVLLFLFFCPISAVVFYEHPAGIITESLLRFWISDTAKTPRAFYHLMVTIVQH